MESLSEELLAFIVILGAVALGYGKFMGPYQTELTEAFCQAFGVKSRYKKMWNLGVGVTLGLVITGVAAYYMGNWGITPLGFLAGIFASSEAAKKHDEQAVKEEIADEVVDQVGVHDTRNRQFIQKPNPSPR